MKRREFINRNFLTLGGVLIGQNISYSEVLSELADAFAGTPHGTYDVVIHTAGLSGFFMALEASRKGLKVLVVDKRTSPGFDIAAKRKLWLGSEGFDKWSDDLIDLFFPAGELPEIGDEHMQGKYKSEYKERLLLFGGSLKKGMLHSLLANQVDVLLMTDICGILTDANNRVSGVTLASKHGLYSVRCGQFVDASDNCLFTRDLFRQKYKITEAGFIFEVQKSRPIRQSTLEIDRAIGVNENRVYVHKGKKQAGHYLFEFKFNPQKDDISEIEQQARLLTGEISKRMPFLSPSLAEAKVRYYATECSYYIPQPVSPVSGIGHYSFIESPAGDYTCHTLLAMRNRARQQANKISKYMTRRQHTYIYYIGGKSRYTPNDTFINENGKTLPLSPFEWKNIKINTIKTQILIAGGGTAGSMAALGATEKHRNTLVVEYFHDLGGTKTMAGVYSYYRGYQEHAFLKKHKDDIKRIASEYNMVLSIPRCYFYLATLKKTNCRIINGAIICKAEVKGRKLESIVICRNGRLERISAPLTVDATGDADIAFMAGERYEVGDSRMGITQNYSHWDIPFHSEVKDYNRDYDVINSTEIWEQQRGLYLAHYESHYYDFYPMQAIRESRRPKGVHRIDTWSVMKNELFPDTIAQARSDYDPHYFGSSEYSRCAFMLPHYDKKALVNIPYRSIVPATIDGLLFSGKAISESYKALQFTRMSADVTVLGYVTGLIAADIVGQGIHPRDFSVKNIQEELQHKNYLPALNIKEQSSDITGIVESLSAGDEEALFKSCLEKKETIVPELEKAFDKNKNIVCAKALAWHGNEKGIDRIISELERQYEEELQTGHPADYFEAYDPSILYWKINQNIGLLAMSRSKASRPVINRILSGTKSGGKRVAAADAYNAGRIDLQLVPYYNRIVNLCFYIERNPDRLFIPGLEKLLEDEHIKGYKTTDYSQTRWKFYGANLELFIATAAARSGSQKGADILIHYLNDIHSDFRKFARKELTEIYETDNGYDTDAWRTAAKKYRNRLNKVTPFITETEVDGWHDMG